MQPPLTPAAPDEPLYEAFYGLREQPFALTTDPRFLFKGEAHRRAYEELLTGLRRREGLMILTGDTGLGKTTLCRAVIEALGPRTFSAIILNPFMSDAEVLRVILRDFGLVTRDEIRHGAFAKADVPQLLDTLEGFLRSVVALDSHAVVVIDEAQSLSPKVLHQIRVLGGYEMDGRRLLQIILVGQPDLLTLIKSDALRALDDRISRRPALGPLPIGDVDAYIRHRLRVAGGQDVLEFTPESVKLIADLSRGVPRRINLLCDRTLEEGRIEGTNTITPAIVRRGHQAMSGAAAAAVARVEPVEPVAPVRPVGPVERVVEPVEPASLVRPVPDLALHPADGTTESPSVGGPALMFGGRPAAPRRWGRTLIVLLVVLVLVGAALGGWAAWTISQSQTEVAPLPEAPVRDLGVLPGPFPTPTEAEQRYLLQEFQRLNPTWRPDGGGG